MAIAQVMIPVARTHIWQAQDQARSVKQLLKEVIQTVYIVATTKVSVDGITAGFVTWLATWYK